MIGISTNDKEHKEYEKRENNMKYDQKRGELSKRGNCWLT